MLTCMDSRTVLVPQGTWGTVDHTRHLLVNQRRDRDGTIVGTACRMWLPGIDTADPPDGPAARTCGRCAAIPPVVRRMACLDTPARGYHAAEVQDWVEGVYTELCTVGATNLLTDVLCGQVSLHDAVDRLREIGRDVPDHPAQRAGSAAAVLAEFCRHCGQPCHCGR